MGLYWDNGRENGNYRDYRDYVNDSNNDVRGGLGIRGWILPPLSNSCIIIIMWLYIALNRTPYIDCYWVGAVPKF